MMILYHEVYRYYISQRDSPKLSGRPTLKLCCAAIWFNITDLKWLKFLLFSQNDSKWKKSGCWEIGCAV